MSLLLKPSPLQRTVGVYADDKKLYVTEIEQTAIGIVIRYASAAVYKEEQDADSLVTDAVLQAESLQSICARYGVSSAHCAWIYTRAAGHVYEKTFPPLSDHELAAAIALDMEASCPYTDGTYWMGYRREEDLVLVAALPQERATDLVTALDVEEIALDAMLLAPTEIPFAYDPKGITIGGLAFCIGAAAQRATWDTPQVLSLYAAMALLHPGGYGDIDFLPKSPWYKLSHRTLWKSLLPAISLVWIVALVGIFATQFWRIHTLENELATYTAEYAAHTVNYERVQRIRRHEAESEKVKTALVNLSSARQSWYYILYTLGTVTVNDVCLKHWEMKEPRVLRCEGVALTYELLFDYMQLLEENRNDIGAVVHLVEFSTTADGSVRFLLEFTYDAGVTRDAK